MSIFKKPTNTRNSFHRDAVKRVNHILLNPPGEGLKQMNATQKKTRELKIAATQAKHALEMHVVTTTPTPKTPVKKVNK